MTDMELMFFGLNSRVRSNIIIASITAPLIKRIDVKLAASILAAPPLSTSAKRQSTELAAKASMANVVNRYGSIYIVWHKRKKFKWDGVNLPQLI